jgi:hypothetical protein
VATELDQLKGGENMNQGTILTGIAYPNPGWVVDQFGYRFPDVASGGATLKITKSIPACLDFSISVASPEWKVEGRLAVPADITEGSLAVVVAWEIPFVRAAINGRLVFDTFPPSGDKSGG